MRTKESNSINVTFVRLLISVELLFISIIFGFEMLATRLIAGKVALMLSAGIFVTLDIITYILTSINKHDIDELCLIARRALVLMGIFGAVMLLALPFILIICA